MNRKILSAYTVMTAAFLFSSAAYADDCANLPISFSNTYAWPASQNDQHLNMHFTALSSDPDHSHIISDATTPNATATFNDYPIEIPPQGLFYFWPRNFQILFQGYSTRPNPGDTISVTFIFDDGCQKTVDNIPVKNAYDVAQ